MLRARIIPCLLVHNKGLYKTVKFKDPKYVGDPINAVRIFNEKESDELMVIDIDASITGAEPNYTMIEKLAAECRMPLAYGGGVKNIEQARKIFALGVEKISLSSAAFDTPELITEMANQVGAQSVVVVIDYVKKRFGGYEMYTHNGTKRRKGNIVDFAREMESLGAGEIIINSIDRDGTMSGYDIEMANKIRAEISIPLTVLGGAGSHQDIGDIISEQPVVGAAAGSLFVFKGPYRAVLINYPESSDKIKLMKPQ